jgi:multisubunit Na+/H+ antiporter MnhF subunit
MLEVALNLGFGMLALAMLLGAVRLVRGPSIMDRVLAFDLITTCAVGMIVLLSIRWRTELYLELILVFSLLGFLTTVAFVFYLNRAGSENAMGQGTDRSAQPPGSR